MKIVILATVQGCMPVKLPIQRASLSVRDKKTPLKRSFLVARLSVSRVLF